MTHPDKKTLVETMRRLKICVLVPTYNNAGTLKQVLDGIREYSDDIIVVNDGSTDSTKEILDAYGEAIKVVSYSTNKGKGYALKRGFKEALSSGYNYAITLDSDGQHLASDIPKFVKAVAENYGALIIGERDLSNVDINGKSTFANKFSNFWFTVHTARKLNDTQTGFRAYPLKSISGKSILTNRYEAELELLVLSAWADVKLVSIPIQVYYPPRSERVSHFRPAKDFTRISILNTIFCFLAIVYGYPRLLVTKLLKRELLNGEFRPFTMRKGKHREANITLGRLFRSIYALSHFIFWSVFVFKPYVFFSFRLGKTSEKKRERLHRQLQKISKFFSRNFPGGKAEIINEVKEDFSRPAVIVANHQSNLDLPILLSVSPKLIFITKDWVWNNSFFGPIVREAGFLPISWGIDKLIDQLRVYANKGYSIVIFPEGSRSEDGKIGRFKQGAFALARELELDIMPMVLHGPSYYLPKNDFMLRKNPQILKILPRVKKGTFEGEPAYKEASAVRKIIRDEYEALEDSVSPGFFRSLVLYKFAYRGWDTVSRVKRELRHLPEYEKLISNLSGKNYFFNPGLGTIPILAAFSNREAEIICCVENLKDYETLISVPGLPENLTVRHTVWENELKDIERDSKVFIINSETLKADLSGFKPVLIKTK